MRNTFPRAVRMIVVVFMCLTLIYSAKHTATYLRYHRHFARYSKTFSRLPSNFFGVHQLAELKTLMGFRTKSVKFRAAYSGNVTTNAPSNCLRFETQFEKVKKGPLGIPKIIHQVYMSNLVPLSYMSYLTKCQNVNQDFIHVIWTDNDFIQFLQMKRPQWLPILKKFVAGIEKADVMRLMILQHYGGIYMDMDVECVRPLSDYLKLLNVSLLFDQERNMQSVLRWNVPFISMNSVMISRPGHPFLQQLIDKLASRAPLRLGAVSKTGPFFILSLYKEYIKRKLKLEDQVGLASPDHFSPLLDPILFKMFSSKCLKPNSAPCKEWLGQGQKQNVTHEIIVRKSFLVHHFLHLGYGSKAKLATRDVCKTDLKLFRFYGNQTVR